jgi:arylsulfatase A-like enzyme
MPKKQRNSFPTVAHGFIMAAAVFSGWSLFGGAQPQRPTSALVILLDDVGVDLIGAYNEGSKPAHTPRIDKLARQGVLFRNAYANPVCSTTRSTIQTGRYSFRTGVGYLVNETGYALPQAEVTIPELLDAGLPGTYAHAAFGKWHMGNGTVGGPSAPNQAGYSHYAGLLANVPSSGSTSYFSWPKTINGVTTPVTGYLTTDTVNDAVQWISSQNGPWFAYVALHAPHVPYHNPPANLHTVDLSAPTTSLQYAAMLEAADTEIGRLLDALEAQGKLKHTTVFVIGDNGSADEGTYLPFTKNHNKGTVYEGGINVPFIVAGPYVKHPGSVSNALVGTVDVFATIAEIAHIDLASVLGTGVHLDSVSIVPYLKNPKTPSIRKYQFAEEFLPNGTIYGTLTPQAGATLNLKAIRDFRYKLILNVLTQTEEFYDLEQDPFETSNLLSGQVLTAGTPEAQAYASLKAQLASLLQ